MTSKYKSGPRYPCLTQSQQLFHTCSTTNMQFTKLNLFVTLVVAATATSASPPALFAAATARPYAAVDASDDVLLRKSDQAIIAQVWTDICDQRKLDQAIIAQVWTDADKGGQRQDIAPASLPLACLDFKNPFQDNISSLSVEDGVMCTFFRHFRCNGPSFSVRNIFITNLTAPFNNELSAVSCEAA